MVAHDRWLLSQTGCEIWALDEQGIHHFPTFQAYDDDRHAKATAAASETKKEQPAISPADQGDAQRRSMSRDELKRLKRQEAEARNAMHKKLKPLKDQYAKLEARLNDVMTAESDAEQKLADPATYAKNDEYTALLNSYNSLKSECEDLMDKMAQLETQINAIENEAGKDSDA